MLHFSHTCSHTTQKKNVTAAVQKPPEKKNWLHNNYARDYCSWQLALPHVPRHFRGVAFLSAKLLSHLFCITLRRGLA